METRLEQLTLKVADDSLSATMLAPATTLPGVLFVHGWGGSQQQDLDRAQAAAGLGCVCLTFDLRGHQRNDAARERVTREENLADLVAAYDWLTEQRNVDPSAIAVIGTSYGGYLAALLSALRPVRWLALRVPALYKDADWHLPKRRLHDDADLPAYRRRRLHWRDNRALGACAQYRGDVLIIASEHDDLVPSQVIRNYTEAFIAARSMTLRVISAADHALTSEPAQQSYNALLERWLIEMVVGARTGSGRRAPGGG